ncbi:MAG: hypothetical protein IPG35_04745 [Flavobacteriales bacterium]|nr:hypothetical protein [Flavobacteriales bacterium]
MFANVTIYSDCVVGANCIIHSGTVIGSDGFRFATGPNAAAKIPQIGNVVIEDDVEIGANCAIDRATLGSTILRRGVKFDNLIHIAHNVEVGENTYYAAGGVVAGSTRIGKNCMFSGQVGIIGHLKMRRWHHHRGAERHQQGHQGGRGLHGLTGVGGRQVPQELHPLPQPRPHRGAAGEAGEGGEGRGRRP